MVLNTEILVTISDFMSFYKICNLFKLTWFAFICINLEFIIKKKRFVQ